MINNVIDSLKDQKNGSLDKIIDAKSIIYEEGPSLVIEGTKYGLTEIGFKTLCKRCWKIASSN